jgi:hypothetical protein
MAESTDASRRERVSMTFWFTLYDLAGLLRRPFVWWSPDRIARGEMTLVKVAVYCQRRGFGWID